MFNRENYDISPEDAEKSIKIRRHTADLAILDLEAGTPFFWDNDGIAFKRMISIKTGYAYQHNTIPMIYAAREHGYTDCRWGGILALKGSHLYKQDEGVELEIWANEISLPKKDADGNQLYDKNGHPIEEMIKLSRPQIKVERLYNGSAISGLGKEPEPLYNWMEKNEIKKRLLENCKAKLVFDQTENNFYVKDTDTIHMVPEEKWKNKDEFLVELYHCISHSTLIDSRAGKNPFFLDLKKRCGKSNYAVEELVVEMATYRFRTKYGLKIGDSHKKAHGEYLTRWSEEIDRNPNMLNYTYSDSYAILNYISEHIVQFTKDEQQALRYKFNYWKKKHNQKAAVKEYQKRESAKAGRSDSTARPPAQTTENDNTKNNAGNAKALKPKIDKPVDHGIIKRVCPVYHPDYGKGFTQDYITENGKTKIGIIFGEGGPGTGSGFYSLAQLQVKYSKWYFGNEAIAKAEAYYEAQKKAKAAAKNKTTSKAADKPNTDEQQSDVSAPKIKVGQVILSRSTGKGIIDKIYKDDNNVDMVHIKYSSMTLAYRLTELKDKERFTIIDDIKAAAEVKRKTEVVKQTIEKPEITVHEHHNSTVNVVEEIVKEPRKDYHRKLNSQEVAIADTVVRYVRNIPAEKQNDYGNNIRSTSEQFAKEHNIPTPPPIQTAALKKSRLINITAARDMEQSASRERVRETSR